MASVAAPARQRPQRAPRPRPAAPPAARPRPAPVRARLTGGLVWIVVVAALLAGIVALNVAVLGLNMQVEELERQREKLLARHDALSSELSTAAAAGRIERLAKGRLGLVPPESTTYVTLRDPR